MSNERQRQVQQPSGPPPGRGSGGGPRGGGPRGPHGPMFVEKPKDMKGTLKRMISYIGRDRYLMLSLVGIVVVVTLLGLVGPALQGQAIDMITLENGDEHVNLPALVKLLLFMALIYAVQAAVSCVQGILAAKLSRSTVRAMRNDLFHSIMRLPIRYTDTHNHGDIMSRMTNDVDTISHTISNSLASLVSAVLTVTGVLAVMFYYNWLLAIVNILMVPLSMLVTRFIAGRSRKYYKQQQAILGQLNGDVEEKVTALKTVTAYSTQKKSYDNFEAISIKMRGTAIKAQIYGSIMGPVMNFIGNFSFLVIAALGGYLALTDVITIGTIAIFINYSKQFNRPINEIANQYNVIQTAIAGAERVFAIMDQKPEIDEGKHPITKEDIQGDIDFEHIHFSYVEGEKVLRDFDLHVKKGQRIAIVGATGSGKTTIVNLLTRFYEIDSGAIKVDGVDVRDIKKDVLRSAIAIVLQDTVLFLDTIKENIKYGNLEASDADIIAAAKIANADKFVDRLPEGYDTMLAESGSNLSQGQRQLLSIARAVLADPKILILDEATSSIDTRTELHIQEAMLKLMENRTSLIIAHRLSTIRDADKIIVLDAGHIVEAGNHEELLAAKGKYYELYQTQFAGMKT
ncbi:MAG: ABC transporter ATP-binding protein [Clostridia bacterium]|nr:ABC transporter ATP-binding protein [Clostridia bacterium]